MKVGVYLNTTTGGADYHKQAWVKGFAQGIRAMQSVDYQVDVTDSKKIMPGYDYSFCFSYQSDHYKKTSPMALLRRELIDFHAEDGKIFFMDSDVLISYQREHFTGSQSKLRETEQGLRYVRVPLGHVHHPHAKHFYKDGWEDRWLEIKKNKGIEVKEYENDPNKPILLVCNRGTEGYGGGGIAAWQWARDTIEELIKHITPIKEDKVIIGGNFARWYGGFQSYIVANEFGCEKWSQDSHAKRELEHNIPDLNHLQRLPWAGWMNVLSTFKYAIHLMPTVAAGTFSLNCAYFGIPCIGNIKVDTQRFCHPDLSVAVDDVSKARTLAHRLQNDSDFYDSCSTKAKKLYREP